MYFFLQMVGYLKLQVSLKLLKIFYQINLIWSNADLREGEGKFYISRLVSL